MQDLGVQDEGTRPSLTAFVDASGKVPPEQVQTCASTRQAYAEKLLSLPAERACQVLSADLDRLQRAMERLEEGGKDNPDWSQRTAILMGQQLRWILWLGDAISGEVRTDPLALIEQELDRAGERGGELLRLDEEFQEQGEQLGRDILHQRGRILRGRLSRYLQTTDVPEDPRPSLEEALAAWRAASEGYQLEMRLLEVADLRKDNRPNRREGHEQVLSRLDGTRRAQLELTEELAGALSDEDLASFADASVTDLVDCASGYLTDGGGWTPSARAELLLLLRQQTDDLIDVLKPHVRRVLKNTELAPRQRQRLRTQYRNLLKTRRQGIVAETECMVQSRIDETFGVRNARRFENLIMVLIFTFLGMVFLEWRLPLDTAWIVSLFTSNPGTIAFFESVVPHALLLFHYFDIVFCVIFQIDFFVRWYFARFGGGYFMRHFWLESLPALPYGFLLWQLKHVEGGGSIFIVRLLRVRGLMRMRGLILLVTRLFRVIVFLVRGVDRAVEKYRPLLDRDIVIFDQKPLADSYEFPLRGRVSDIESRRQRFLRNFYNDLPWDARAEILPRHVSVLGAEAQISSLIDLPYRRAVLTSRGELRLEHVIRALIDCDVSKALSFLGRDGAQSLARYLRFFDFPIIRSTPIIRRIVPASRILNPAEAVAAAANSMGEFLQELLGVLRFWGDLSGITTGPQILDRIATGIITASKRPAVRLLLFGGLLLLFWAFVDGLKIDALAEFAGKLEQIVGLPLIILGITCLVFLIFGMWLKRIAGEALEQYMRIADACYYPLLKSRKLEQFDKDIEALADSVLLAESRLRIEEEIDADRVRQFLATAVEARLRPDSEEVFDPDDPLAPLVQERNTVGLMYRDWIDGPVLHRSDDKTSGQLLGNLTLHAIRTQVLEYDKRRLKKLKKLDLGSGKVFSLGPYFWFRFITESLAIETAKLIAEYNARCIPKARRHLASNRAQSSFEKFIEEHRSRPEGAHRGRAKSKDYVFGDSLMTNSFTAFDFLGPSLERDEEVRRRYGDEVLECLEKDRCGVVRDIFGTRPYHLLPREQRVLNPYILYRKYLGGAKILLLPLVIIIGFLRINWIGMCQVGQLVSEVLGRRKVLRSQMSRVAGFDVAIRKINRMRKPFFMEALHLRASVDVEYFGLRIPGSFRSSDIGSYQRDLDFIGALQAERRPIRELRNRAVRDLRSFRGFLGEKGWLGDGFREFLKHVDPTGALSERRGEVMRALTTAFITDHRSMRSLVMAPADARQFVLSTLGNLKEGFWYRLEAFLFCNVLGFFSRKRVRRRIFDQYVERHEELQELDAKKLAGLRTAFYMADRDTERTLLLANRVLDEDGEDDDGVLLGVIKSVAREASLWTRRIVTLRAAQTLTVLDIRSYREMVWEVGGYEDD